MGLELQLAPTARAVGEGRIGCWGAVRAPTASKNMVRRPPQLADPATFHERRAEASLKDISVETVTFGLELPSASHLWVCCHGAFRTVFC